MPTDDKKKGKLVGAIAGGVTKAVASATTKATLSARDAARVSSYGVRRSAAGGLAPTTTTSSTAETQARSGEILIGPASQFAGTYQAAYGAAGGMFPQSQVYGASVLPTTFTGATPTLLDPRALLDVYNRNPVRPQELIGGNVEDQLRQQAVARKTALEAKLAQLDSGYNMASEQIHGGYRAVADLLTQAQGNYTSGMGSVTAGQAAGNAGVQQSGMQQADAVARILASQGITGVGAGQADAAAASAQAGANAVGSTAAGALAGGQSTLNTFFSGLPALAAMGEAGGIGQAELMRTLTKGRATSDSADAGLSAEQAIRDADLNYRRQVASQDVQATRARDDQVIQSLLAALSGNQQTTNQFKQFNATGTSQAAASTVGDLNARSRAEADARTQAAYRAMEQRNAFAMKVAEDTASQRAAVEKAKLAGLDPAKGEAWLREGLAARQALDGYYNKNIPFKLKAQLVPPAGAKWSKGDSGAITKPDGSVDASKYNLWAEQTGGDAGDLALYMAMKGVTKEQAYRALSDIADQIASTQGVAGEKTPTQNIKVQQDMAKQINARLQAQYNSYSGSGADSGYFNPTTGKLETLPPLLANWSATWEPAPTPGSGLNAPSTPAPAPAPAPTSGSFGPGSFPAFGATAVSTGARQPFRAPAKKKTKATKAPAKKKP